MKKGLFACFMVLSFLVVWTGTSNAADELFVGSSGTLAASADFNLLGSTLTVTLTNTSSATATDPVQVLTGLFFDTTHTLTPVAAALGGSSTVLYGSFASAG